MSETGSGSSGAWCALHRDRAAADICGRCGAFMCGECNQQGRSSLCPGCLGRAGAPERTFPLGRDRWSLGELFDLAWAGFTREWLMLGVMTLVFGAVSMAVYLFTSAVQWGFTLAISETAGAVAMIAVSPLQYAVVYTLSLGTFRIYSDVLGGKKVDLGVLFSQFGKFGKVLLQTLAAIGLVLVPFGLWAGLTAAVVFAAGQEYAVPIAVVSGLLVLVPFIWVLLPFYFIHPELALQDSVGPVESIKNSFVLVRGARWPVLGMGLLVGLVQSVGVILCCVGLFASIPLGQLVLTGLYLALRRGSELDPPHAEPAPLPPVPVPDGGGAPAGLR